jgi:amino acid permease
MTSPRVYDSISDADSRLKAEASSEAVSDAHHHAPPKTIDFFGSIALITNNICGPAMMSLPSLFRAAGIIPTVVCILFIFLCSTLVGLFLGESIQGVPGNKEFRRNLDFSQVFGQVAGEKWYHIVQMLVVLSCMSQIFTAVVETSQALDGFLASFVLGKTYALQLSTMTVIEWSNKACEAATLAAGATQSGVSVDLCTPFADADFGVVTLGYLATTAFFLPMGLGDLKETIIVQLISFVAFFAFIWQFEYEFFAHKGLHFMDSVPWVGTDFSQLAGVVLFNYAYPITVPSWLNEKKLDVPTSKVVWFSSTLSTAVYILFGITAAGAFSDTGADMLVVLSSAQVSHQTNLMAAFFSVCIIGCGAPVFCVIVHSMLSGDGHFSPRTSLFLGSIFPYMFSMFMYQGHLLMDILNWSGLVVNGTVASILPMVLAYLCYQKRKTAAADADAAAAEPTVVTGTLTNDNTISDGSSDDNNDGAEAVNDVIKPLPSFLEPFRGFLLLSIITAFSAIIVGTLALDLVTGTSPQD